MWHQESTQPFLLLQRLWVLCLLNDARFHTEHWLELLDPGVGFENHAWSYGYQTCKSYHLLCSKYIHIHTYIHIYIYMCIFRISQYTGNQPNKNQGEIFSDLDLNWKFHAHNFHSTVIPNEAPHVELRHQKRDGTENLCGPLLAHCLTVLARKLELHSKLLVVSGFFEGLFENRSLHEKEKKHLTFPYQVCSDAMPRMFFAIITTCLKKHLTSFHA